MSASGHTISRATEAQFQAAVIDVARLHGWRVHHARPARTAAGWRTPITGDVGFPDLVLAHPRRGLIIAEIKTQTGRLSGDQEAWLIALSAATRRQERVRVCLWRPSDWEAIVARLSERVEASA
jgi:hypothetical protein